jgi:hypothetical protein
VLRRAAETETSRDCDLTKSGTKPDRANQPHILGGKIFGDSCNFATVPFYRTTPAQNMNRRRHTSANLEVPEGTISTVSRGSADAWVGAFPDATHLEIWKMYPKNFECAGW